MSATGSRRAVCLLAGFLCAESAGGQEPSAIERQTPDFYGAVGGPVSAAWSVSPETIPLDGEATLTLTVRGAKNPDALARPDLAALPAWRTVAGVVQVTPAGPPAPGAGEVAVRYTLRPKRVGPLAIPALTYRYYRPGFPEGKRFGTAFADAVTLTVTPPPPPPPVPLDAPEWFFAAAESRTPLPTWAWLGTVPLGLIAGRIFTPRRPRARPDRISRLTLKKLTAAAADPDPARATAGIVREYLSARAGVPAALTTGEVGPALAAAGWPGDRVTCAVDLLAACDAARFAPASGGDVELARRAAGLVAAWAGGRA